MISFEFETQYSDSNRPLCTFGISQGIRSMAQPTVRSPRSLSELAIRSAAVLLAVTVCAPASAASSASGESGTAADAAPLVSAYPDFIKGIERNDLVWKDGDRMPIWDGKGQKDFATLLEQPDIKDMFQLPYVAGPPKAPPTLNEDPGRIRNEAFFAKMYGDCEKGEVGPRMRAVKWMPSYHGGIVMVTTVNGVADKLEAVVRDLEKLPSALMKYLVPSGGTYNCRGIAGTQRRSMHAYGAAVDISTKYSDYWRWPLARHDLIQYRNKIPFEIVDVFERHGFIWGGKWYHFDTMHFEYRPELMPARLIRSTDAATAESDP